jgi:hypothetical protein
MKTILIAGIVIVGIFLIVLAFIPLGIEPLTEVYFENHTALPSSVELNHLYNFSYTIHNLEYQKVRYVYNVKMYDEEGNFLKDMSEGEVTLLENESSTIENAFTLSHDFNRTKIQVNVTKDLSLEDPKFKHKLWWPDPNYPMSIDIHFWIEEKI